MKPSQKRSLLLGGGWTYANGNWYAPGKGLSGGMPLRDAWKRYKMGGEWRVVSKPEESK